MLLTSQPARQRFSWTQAAQMLGMQATQWGQRPAVSGPYTYGGRLHSKVLRGPCLRRQGLPTHVLVTAGPCHSADCEGRIVKGRQGRGLGLKAAFW